MLLPAIAALALLAQPYSFADVKAVRDHILSHMDAAVPPGHGVQVHVQLVIFKIISVDLTAGLMTLKVWQRSSWNDPRLAWNESEFGGVTEIRAYPGMHSGGEADGIDNQMWVPDVHWYNTVVSHESTSEVGASKVTSDGTVLRSFPGRLEISCRFTGLVNFPHDELSCPFDVGSWAYSDSVVNLTFFDTGGVVIELNQETSGTSYQDYGLARVDTERVTQFYPGWGDYTNLFFRVYLTRPSLYYFFMLEFPAILLTAISHVVHWLDVTMCGERLGLSGTMLLANQVIKIVTIDKLPVCGEMLWVEFLLLINELFCVLNLLISCFAVYRAFRRFGTVDEHASDAVDLQARWSVPALHACALGIIYSIELEDGYLGNGSSMFMGLAPGIVAHVGFIFIMPSTIIVVAVADRIYKHTSSLRRREARGRTPAAVAMPSSFSTQRDKALTSNGRDTTKV